MTELTVTVKQNVTVKYLLANMGVRYWEDAKVNGVDEDDDSPKIPFYHPNGWKIKIDLETGKIIGWPKGVTAETHYKVCDAGLYKLLNEQGETIAARDWYVPSMLCPNASGYGDYVILKIDGEGQIDHWDADLSFFDEDED